MKHYLLSIYQPDEGVPEPEVLAEVMRELEVLNEEIKAAGSWVFSGGLHAPSTATVVQARDGSTLVTDGPFAEGKEHLGGVWVIAAADLDVALRWAEQAARATGLPIEVRPFQERVGS